MIFFVEDKVEVVRGERIVFVKQVPEVCVICFDCVLHQFFRGLSVLFHTHERQSCMPSASCFCAFRFDVRW